MTSEPEDIVSMTVTPDAVLEIARDTGKLPQHWWTSDGCWRMLAKLAGQFANSSMVPQAYRNEPGNVMVALAAGMPLGLSPLACVQSVAVINGRPMLWGDAVIAQVLAHPSLLQIEEAASGTIETNDREWAITIERKLPSGQPQTTRRTFSIKDASRAGLWGKAGPWKTYPDRMLFNRARAFAVRDAFADVLAGASIAADLTEEVRPVEATIRDASPMPSHTLTENAESLAPDVSPVVEPAPKPRRKKRTAAQIAKEEAESKSWATLIHSGPPDAKPDLRTPLMDLLKSDGVLKLEEFGDSMDHLERGTLFVGPELTTMHICDGEGWQLIDADHDEHKACNHFALSTLRKRVATLFLNKRMSGADAMAHAQQVLGLPALPTGMNTFDIAQLADLVSDMR